MQYNEMYNKIKPKRKEIERERKRLWDEKEINVMQCNEGGVSLASRENTSATLHCGATN